MIRKKAITVLMLLTLGFTNVAVSQGDSSAPAGNNAALLENIQRMQMYNGIARQKLSAPDGDAQTTQAVAQDHGMPAVDTALSQQGYASPEIFTALELLIEATNLSPAQRAQLVHRLREGDH